MKAIAIDIETTGLPSRVGWNKYFSPEQTRYYDQSRVISIGIVSDDFSKYNLIRPCGTFKNNPTAFETHGISEERIKAEGISLQEFFTGEVIYLLKNAKFIVAHNVQFDINVLRSDLIRSALTDLSDILKNARLFCTMEEGKKIMGTYKSPRLTELYRKLFQEDFEAHNALEDAKASFRCYKELIL
jgi:DNA polymerase-3 subunit alpha